MKETKKEPTHIINEKIRAPRVQLILHDGENIGVVTRDQAIKMAHDAGLDLVLISDQGREGVPVAKVMDLGKELYKKKKKQAEAKKHQKVIQIKEVKMRPKIGVHDYLTKIKQAVQFLQEGKRVKITLSFKGRENVSKDERGTGLFDKITASFAEYGFTDNLVQEHDAKIGQVWSRIYYLKGK